MAVQFTLTNAGTQAIVNSSHDGTQELTLTKIVIGTGNRAPAATDTALVTEAASANASGAVNAADDEIAVTANFTGATAITVTEIGVMARVGDGAEFLFAYWSTADATVAATKQAGLNLRITGAFKLTTAAAANITFAGEANIIFEATNAATEATAGITRYATTEEAAARDDVSAALKPNQLPTAATTTVPGLVERATNTEATAGTDTQRYTTPAHLAAAVGAIGLTVEEIWSGSANSGTQTLNTGKQFSDYDLITFVLSDSVGHRRAMTVPRALFAADGVWQLINDTDGGSVITHASDTTFTLTPNGGNFRNIYGIKI